MTSPSNFVISWPVAAFSRHAIDVLPAVALAHPQEGAAAVDPLHLLDHVDPFFDSSRNTRLTSPVLTSAVRKSLRFCSRFNCWIETVVESIHPMRAR